MTPESRVRVAEMAYPEIGRWGVMVGDQCLLRCRDTPEGKHEAEWQVEIIREAIRAAVAAERDAWTTAVNGHACQHGTTCVGGLDILQAMRA